MFAVRQTLLACSARYLPHTGSATKNCGWSGAGGKEEVGIEEYSLSQATLEQVFIHMAREASQADSTTMQHQ